MAMTKLLDPRFKLKLLEYFFPLIYGDDITLLDAKNSSPATSISTVVSAPTTGCDTHT